MKTREEGVSAFLWEARDEMAKAHHEADLAKVGGFRFELRRGSRHVWVVVVRRGTDVAALRVGYTPDGVEDLTFTPDAEGGGAVVEVNSTGGVTRAKITFPGDGSPLLRCYTTMLPSADMNVAHWPRDFYALEASEGVVHTYQRGLRSGIVFAGYEGPHPLTVLYFQNFTSLNEYFQTTGSTPADSVGGTWPELGYSPPGGEAVLTQGQEVCLYDTYVMLADDFATEEAQTAARYLDMLAEVYTVLDNRPAAAFHDWPALAGRALIDLTFSPECDVEYEKHRYLLPYVGDSTKPPESMVQLTLAVNVREYDTWRGSDSRLGTELIDNVGDFFDPAVGTVMRWLPDQDFGEQSEENMNHRAMDSWYLLHPLLNLARLSEQGLDGARKMFKQSLEFAVRVAHRFDYRWPVFFDVQTLDMIRAESEPGRGGESDVTGIYALVMLHAFEQFGDQEYLVEAQRAAKALEGLGFELGYQMNTTAYAAEAMLRLWRATGERTYLDLSEICMASLFDNAWLWQCDYGHATHYDTFLGIFPLRDAPYLAAYEEVELQGTFHNYLELGGKDVRPSLRLLLAEYQRYSLARSWSYYPESLPADIIADKPRNGSVYRDLAVPVEDLQDGREECGQVGQEVYGAGLPFIHVARYYHELPDADYRLFCDYPVYDVQTRENKSGGSISFRVGGDPRGTCEIRLTPTGPDGTRAAFTAHPRGQESRPAPERDISPQGHVLFQAEGGQALTIRWRDANG